MSSIGYRLEYASSARAKCKGSLNLDSLFYSLQRCSSSLSLILFVRCDFFFLGWWCRSQAMFRLVLMFYCVSCYSFFNGAFSSIGTPIGKGELRVGTLVEMRGIQSL